MVYEGSHRLGEFFNTRREKGSDGLPMLSVTMNDGLVDRESLGRKMETNLAHDEHLLVKAGDIAYNMMRMWQGASGRAEKDGLVSPAYVVLTPKKNMDSLYAAYLFKSHRLLYLFRAYSYGLTDDRLRLYFTDFARIPVAVPEIEKQKTIAELLTTWDRAIEVASKLVANSKAQKNALMQQLLARKGRITAKAGEWVEVPLRNILSVRRDLAKPTNEMPLFSLTIEDGVTAKTERYDREFLVRDSTVKRYKVVFPNDIVYNPANLRWGAISISRLQQKVVVSPIYEVLFIKDVHSYSDKLVAHILTSPRQVAKFACMGEGTIMERVAVKIEPFLATKVLMPKSITEQRKVASVLDAADSDVRHHVELLKILTREKQGIMQQLLSGTPRVMLDVGS